jgi:hypothetical protein
MDLDQQLNRSAIALTFFDLDTVKGVWGIKQAKRKKQVSKEGKYMELDQLPNRICDYRAPPCWFL